MRALLRYGFRKSIAVYPTMGHKFVPGVTVSSLRVLMCEYLQHGLSAIDKSGSIRVNILAVVVCQRVVIKAPHEKRSRQICSILFPMGSLNPKILPSIRYET